MQLNESTAEALIDCFAAAWNRGDLAGACEVYAPDATFSSKTDFLRGKQAILDHYQKGHNSLAPRGRLSLLMTEFRPKPVPEAGVLLASAFFIWKLEYPDGDLKSGSSLVVFEHRNGQIFIVQDASL